MNRTNKGKPPKGQAYLVCSVARVGGDCTHEQIRYDFVEGAFIWDAEKILYGVPAGSDALNDRLEDIENTLGEIEGFVGRLVRAIERGGSVALEERLREAEAEREGLKDELQALWESKAGAAGYRILERKADELLALLPKQDTGGKGFDRQAANLLIRQLFEKVTVDFDSNRLVFTWKNGGESTGAIFRMPKESRRNGVRRT